MAKPHAPLPFASVDQQLMIGDTTISQLAAQQGNTPFYVYDHSIIDQQLEALRQQLPEQLKIHYAIKANPLPALVNHLASQIDGFDVASSGEMRTALAAGMCAEQISIAGPGKDQETLRAAISAGITINVESSGELARIIQLSEELAIQGRVALRVNPDFELKSAGMKMGGGAKPFGIDAEQIPALLKQLEACQLEFVGFHIFCGSQNLRHEAIIEAQRLSLALAIQLAQSTTLPIRQLNIGGGFGIPYFPGETALDLAPIGDYLAEALPKAQAELGGAEIAIELGRYLVGPAGLYVCQVVDKKVSRGKTYLVTNGGMNHHLAASGNLGQVLRKNYPVAIGNRMATTERECVSIVGPLCTPLDILAENVELPRAEVGDLVVVFQSGAYGLSASPIHFLSHPVPQQVLL